MRLAVGVAWLVAGCALRPPPPASPPRTTHLGLAISQLELTNGLRVIVVEDPRATQVQVTMRYRAGSVDDPPERAGTAHLVEHLMFQQVLGEKSLFAHLEDAASDFNAFTTYDATTYYARAQPAKLDELLSIEAVRLGFRCTTINDSTFVREREVVANEVRRASEVQGIVDAVGRGLYPDGHPYRRAVGGSVESVSAITREQACAFADAHYAPSNAVLVVSGHVNPDGVAASLKKFIAKLPARKAVPPAPVPPLGEPRHVETNAPIDEDVVLLAWPLPSDPLSRAKVSSIVSAASGMIDSRIKGRVSIGAFGDSRAEWIVAVLEPAKSETIEKLLEGARHGIDALPQSLETLGRTMVGEIVFDRIQQGAIYDTFHSLEDGGNRDAALAAEVIAGRDPARGYGPELQALRAMSRDQAASVARDYLNFDRASVVVLKASDKESGSAFRLATPIHDPGQRRAIADPEDAYRPLEPEPARGLAAMRTRQLPNGMQVVLLPLTTVPTIDVRMIFSAGTADEPVGKRGAAILAANGLSFDVRHINDVLRFAAAGGSISPEVERDHTTFATRGLDMHVDLLLAGLRRLVREGRYTRDTDELVAAMRRALKKTDDDGALTDTWRVALYGATHPYVAADLWRHTSENLDTHDAVEFRRAHYRPNAATLVIAGHFDPDLADLWVDYLFGDWSGTAVTRASHTAKPQPASIARAEDSLQIKLHVAMPATGGDRAMRLVAAAMLQEIANDVRHQLAASYDLTARLGEERLATNYYIGGGIDAPRVSEALDLIQKRLAAVRSDPIAGGRAFVAARARVLTQLTAVTASAGMLAERVETDIDLERAPMTDLQTANAVRALTIAAMGPALSDLELSRATMLMRGPRAQVDAAFAALGRRPSYVTAPAQERDIEPLPETIAARDDDDDDEDRVASEDIEDALTAHGPARSVTYTLGTSYSFAQILEHDATGLGITGEVGYRLADETAVGAHVSLGRLGGSYRPSAASPLHEFSVMPLEFALFAQATGLDRLWGTVLLGVHFDHYSETTSTWNKGMLLALEGGVDIVRRRAHRFGVFGRVDGQLIVPEGAYSAFTLGVSYRQ